MKKEVNQIEFETEEFQSYIDKPLAILKLKCNAYESIANISRTRDILPWFDRIENHSELKGVLVLHDAGCLGGKAYNEFLSNIAGKEIDEKSPTVISKFDKSEIRAIEINMLVNFIQRIINFKKLFAVGLRGEIATPFFGLSLAADFRFVTEDLVFLLSHIKYGLHPSGALPYFLPKYIDQSKAVEYLFRGGRINCEEAKKMKLINETFSSDTFEKDCIAELKSICDMDTQVIKSTKSLLYGDTAHLEKYFEMEGNFLYK